MGLYQPREQPVGNRVHRLAHPLEGPMFQIVELCPANLDEDLAHTVTTALRIEDATNDAIQHWEENNHDRNIVVFDPKGRIVIVLNQAV